MTRRSLDLKFMLQIVKLLFTVYTELTVDYALLIILFKLAQLVEFVLDLI